MKLLVGLGNPGARYASTRHNVGWMAVDAIARRHGFGPERAKFQGALAEGRLGGERALILKPETFMNLSGQSVGAALRFLKIEPADVIAFHDELDLAPGRLRVKQGGGHAGHNGLRSMIQHVGDGFTRVRIGIGRPEDKAQVANYVLHAFDKADEAWLGPLLDAVADAAPLLADGDAAGFQNRVALLTAPQRTEPKVAPKPAPPASDAGAGAPALSPREALAAKFRKD